MQSVSGIVAHWIRQFGLVFLFQPAKKISDIALLIYPIDVIQNVMNAKSNSM